MFNNIIFANLKNEGFVTVTRGNRNCDDTVIKRRYN